MREGMSRKWATAISRDRCSNPIARNLFMAHSFDRIYLMHSDVVDEVHHHMQFGISDVYRERCVNGAVNIIAGPKNNSGNETAQQDEDKEQAIHA
ncbi:Uncharacterized protein PBTT_06111 [Plasmodiophora brassicae]